MLIAAKAVIDGDLNLGDFVAVNAYVLSVFTPLAFLGTVYNAIITAVVDMRNLSQLLAEQPDVTDPPRAGPLPVRRDGMSIEFRDVHFNYPEQPQIKGLKGVSFIVPAGTTTAVVGHTGAGK
jgi:ATP-binding cassette subfamily B protein